VQACPSSCPWYLPPCPCSFWRPWPSCTRQHGLTRRDMSEPVVSARHQTTKQRGCTAKKHLKIQPGTQGEWSAWY
jgi:hypothetical protein